jgi:hypothetical protein
MRATVAASLLLALCACGPREHVDPEIADDTHLVLKRGGCMVECPTYELHIGPGGNAIFSGHDFTGAHPLRNDDGDVVLTYNLAYPHRRALFDLIGSKAFAALEPVYSAGVSDGPVTELIISGRHDTRSIKLDGASCARDRHRPGALQTFATSSKPARWVPDLFCETIDLIEVASCAGYWSAETRPPGDPADPRLSPPERCRLQAVAAQ